MSEVAQAEIETTEEEVIETLKEVESEVETEVTEEVKPVEAEEEAEGEFVVTIGEESPPQVDDKKAPEWVKDLRKAQSVLTKENRELKERLAGHERKPEITLGAKPVVSDFEYNYETEKPAEEQYAEALDGWYIKKGQVDKQAEEAQAVEAGNKEAWQAELNAYEVEKTALKLKAPNIEEAEALVKDSLSVVYQGGIIDGADKPALMNLYLGTHPEKLKELSSIKSPAKFLVAVGRLESQLKTGTRKAATNPEKKVVGSGSGASTTDATLDKLEKEAEKTGDRTKILNYKRKQNQN